MQKCPRTFVQIVGAPYNEGGGTNAGRAYIYFGGPSMHQTSDVVLTGVGASDQFGMSVAGVGDVNRDGFADVIVGAYLNDAAGTDAGRGYIYFGGPSMNATADVTLTVYNTLGQIVRVLVNGEMDAGYHRVQFEATGLASGVYMYRMQAGSYMETRRLIVLH